MKQVYTREEVIKIIDELLQYPDALVDAVTSEDPDMDAEDLLNMAEDGITN